MPKKFWDEARIERLKKMHADGTAYAEIARYFDCSRSAVAGACHRLGLALSAQPGRPARPIRPEDKGLPRNAPKPDPAPMSAEEKMRDFFGGSFMGHPIQIAKEPAPAEEACIVAEDTTSIVVAIANASYERSDGSIADFECGLADLKPHQCKWPIGDPRAPDFIFCGAPRKPGKGSYCAHHHKIAYTPPPKRPWVEPKKGGISAKNAVGRY